MEQINLQIRSANVEGNTLSGIVHVFGEGTKIGNHIEKFSPIAFDNAIKTGDTLAFHEHDRSKVLGSLSSGTLRLNRTDQGLEFEVDLPDTSYGHDVKELAKRGDLKGMSFGYLPGEFQRSRNSDGLEVRTHTNVKTFEHISTTALPAFAGTTVQLRSLSYENESVPSQLIRARARVNNKREN